MPLIQSLGQNVNKVATKVQLRAPIQRGLRSGWLTHWIVPALKSNKHYLDQADPCLFLTSQKTRSQASNTIDAIDKLHLLIKETAQGLIEVEPTEETKKQYEALLDKAKEQRERASRAKREKKADRRMRLE